ncbi:MAG: hypothetical protein HY834_09055 [Devosia nanyangense]|uniref:Uncharacterized protein n=1 Tax=Devosia nanyangense TaxID=1228055 RepID=A0A933L095_9HYPH|nr:hypothetical protein [Devosia nanyangense]
MSLRRKIAGVLRALARRIDGAPRLTRPEIEARIAATLAIPRRVNRWGDRWAFDNRGIGNPLVVAIASGMERAEPWIYMRNPDMVAAIARHRAGGGQ